MSDVLSTSECTKKVLQDILGQKYYRNHAAGSGAVHNFAKHEDAVQSVFESNGLTAWEHVKKPKQTYWDWIDDPSKATDMPEMSFVAQPCGTHDSPDFVVKFGPGIVLAIECKSSDGTFPLYNSGGVKQNYIYVFGSKKTDKTTIYLGRDILTVEAQRLIDAHVEEARKRDEELNAMLAALDIHKRGIVYYTRPMINQSGGATCTNYFTHVEREQCEKNVFTFVDKLIEASDCKT
jgi:hypothetical protein